jgi:hypothetical protein
VTFDLDSALSRAVALGDTEALTVSILRSVAGSLVTREAAGGASLSFTHPEDEAATTPGAPVEP